MVAMFIRAEYPKRWASAFDDMLKLAGTDIRLTALFFRILDRVNEEVCGTQQVPSCSLSPSSFAYLLPCSLPPRLSCAWCSALQMRRQPTR